MVETRYKFLRLVDGQIKSQNGDTVWTVGEWQHVEGAVELCGNGFHCSRRMSEAFSYVQGEVVARVECDGEVDSGEDKEAWGSQRLVDVRLWRKEDSVALAVYAAELVLDNFESKFPGDSRPRKAIEAARAVGHSPSPAAESAADAAESAAWSAAECAAWSSRAAWSAAECAAWAARAAWSAAAADAAACAAWAARAAWSARSGLTSKIYAWMEERFETLPVFTPGDAS